MGSEELALRRKAERMAAIGGIARTVQHDINNLLTVIFANLEMLKRTAAEGAPQRQLGRVESAARRFEGTSRAILSLIRRPAGEVGPIRLSEALAAIEPLLAMLLPGPDALALTLAERDPAVLLERSALEEGLIALAREAGEAKARGPLLSLAVDDRAEEGVLELRLAEEVAPHVLNHLAAVAEAAGGRAEREGPVLRLRLPPTPPAT